MTKRVSFDKSAVNLCNPLLVGELLRKRESIMSEISRLKGEIEKTELHQAFVKEARALMALDNEIEAAIEEHGSYQDVKAGLYGLKRKSVSVTYDPKLLREFVPEYADKVIGEHVDAKRLDKIVHAGLATQEQVARAATVTEKFNYLIDCIGPEPENEGKEEG